MLYNRLVYITLITLIHIKDSISALLLFLSPVQSRAVFALFRMFQPTADPEQCTDEKAVRRFPPQLMTEGWTEGKGFGFGT